MMPAVVFFQHGVPALMTADIDKPDQVLDWLQKHKAASTIEEVTGEKLSSF